MKQDAETLTHPGVVMNSKMSRTEFLVAMLALEDEQYVLMNSLELTDLHISRIQLRHMAKNIGSSPTSKQTADLFTRRSRLARQITALREIQATYIPGAQTVLQTLQKARSKDSKASPLSYAETIPLVFPSDLPVTT